MDTLLNPSSPPLSDTVSGSPVVRRALHKLLAPPPAFALLHRGDERRVAAEAFIAEQFLRHHQATISEFLPALLTLRCRGQYCAALGLRPAIGGELFLEHYLRDALGVEAEQVVGGLVQAPVSRHGIIEVGNLVSGRNGASSLLLLLLLAVVERAGYQWVLFTATPEVQRAIDKLGFVIHSVCAANPRAVPGDRALWGNYYRHEPRVVVGFVGQSMDVGRHSPLMVAILEMFDHTVTALAAGLRGGAP